MADFAMSRKFTYILNHFSPNESSHFLHVVNLLDAISAKGCDVVLVIEKSSGIPAFKSSAVSVRTLRSRNRCLRFVELVVLLVHQIRAGYTVTFVRIAAPAAIAAALCHWALRGKSMLWQSGTTHGYDRARPLSVAKVKWWFTSFIPNKLARLLVSEFVTGPEAMVEYYSEVVGVPRKKIRLLYNDIDISRFSTVNKGGARARYLLDRGMAQDTIVLLLVHRLSPVRKTLMYLEPMLEALASLEDKPWHFVLVGGGSDLSAAHDLCAAKRFGGRCQFAGDVPNKDIQYWYGIADIFVHPTHAEGFPRVIIEAMAAGLPIVTTDAGGTRQLLGGKQKKYITDRDRPDDFADALVELIRNPQERVELASENRDIVGRFSTERVAEMYIQAIFS